MTSITILYDTIRLEEKLLIESAKKNNITIEMVDCKKLFIDLDKNSHGIQTVLQRCVSYYRNIHSNPLKSYTKWSNPNDFGQNRF